MGRFTLEAELPQHLCIILTCSDGVKIDSCKSLCFACRERGARALEERLAAEKLSTRGGAESTELGDAAENV